MSLAVDELEQIENRVLSLPRAARVHILQALYASLDIDPVIERAWDEEVLRRLDEVKAGRAEMIEGEDFDRELNALLKK
jgi:putative addiction module component (TIGR02574 family)